MVAPSQAIKLLIANDETPARNRLKDLISDIEGVMVVAEAKNGKEAINLTIEISPDLMLLDIRMPLVDGLEAAKHARKLSPKPQIIFATAYDAYAIKAFELSAIDYFLKPIGLDRLQAAIQKAQVLAVQDVAALKSLQKTRSHLGIHERDRVILVPIEEIIYCRAELKYVTVNTKEQEYLLEESLTHLETEFGNVFLRLHRNCLVAQQSISGYEKRPDEKGDMEWHAILKDVPETIAVSRRQQHLIQKL